MSGRPLHLPAGMFSNYFLTQLTPNIPPTGRLKYFQPVWQRITQDPWVLQVIQGYQLELLSTPTQHLQLTFPRLTRVDQKVLDQEVQELLDKQAVHQISASDTAGFISSLFVVPKKDGGNRPVVNLKPLNQFLVYEHFKMEGIHMLRDLLRQGDYLVKIDLKDAYLTVPIWKGHQKYLRFLWKETLLEFACLPFGLATAPRVFTKLMKPVVAMLRQRGVRLIIYLDDMLIMAESTSLALHHAASALNLLESLGFVVNYHKSQLIPSQQIEFLGFLVDSVTLSLQLPGEKLRKIRKRCQQLLNVGETSIRELSKFLGLLTSSIQAVFPAPLHYRHLQRLKNLSLNTLQSYDAIIPLDSLAKEELVWWRDHLQAWNGKALFQRSVDLVIETDASRKGWGAYCEGVSTGGAWCSNEQRLHINSLELLAGSFAIKTFCKNRVVAHVKLLMDNVSAVAYINKMGGTHSQTLANLAIDLWNWCLDHKIQVSAEHLPGVLNLRADRESRVTTDSSDWKLNPAFFEILVQKWGPLQVDLFASRLTFQLPQFVSWKPDPHAIATDAFLMNWGDIRGYAFPPFALIGRCLQQVMTQNVDHLVLVAPVWPAQPWYPVLLHLAVDKPLLLPVTPELLMKDSQAHPLTNLQLAGWVLSASAIKHQVFRQKLETFCWQHGEETPPVPTLVPGTNGLAGVVNDKLIPFQLP